MIFARTKKLISAKGHSCYFGQDLKCALRYGKACFFYSSHGYHIFFQGEPRRPVVYLFFHVYIYIYSYIFYVLMYWYMFVYRYEIMILEIASDANNPILSRFNEQNLDLLPSRELMYILQPGEEYFSNTLDIEALSTI